MGEMFQLSIELHDTKESTIVWSDRWQEKWENLPDIKSCLSDGLLKALDADSRSVEEVHSSNPKAYELYLKSKQIFSSDFDGYSENNKVLISQSFELIKKAIELAEENLEYKIWNAQLLSKKAEYEFLLTVIYRNSISLNSDVCHLSFLRKRNAYFSVKYTSDYLQESFSITFLILNTRQKISDCLFKFLSI